jgi:cleavage and polyadenylation specificity factor subunit 2
MSAHAAGHTVGGSIWEIRKETEVVIYAVDFNHKKERHLPPSTLVDFKKPSLLITNLHSLLLEPIKHPSQELTSILYYFSVFLFFLPSFVFMSFVLFMIFFLFMRIIFFFFFFTEQITQKLTEGGNVLLPTDSAGRLLELSVVLDQHWDLNKDLRKYTLVVLTNVAFNTFEFAKSELEWMNESVLTAFESSRSNAFAFKYFLFSCLIYIVQMLVIIFLCFE